MGMLLHTCCGPCASYTTLKLGEEGVSPTLFFYNPNIHPYQEQVQRRDSLMKLAEIRNLPVLVEPGYELEEFLAQVAAAPDKRCPVCYRMRLGRTAAKAKELGMDSFGTTLLISPYQNRELICSIGHELAEANDLRFYDADLRPGFRQSQALAKEYGLYRQKYCGCIYSEKDRYYKPPERQE